jgi:hypothetical protein
LFLYSAAIASYGLDKAMSKPQDRTVSRRADGTWQNKRQDAERASSVHTTQAQAEEAARRMLGNQGGGELTTMGVKGKIVSKDTIKPGNDPSPPRDTQH